MNYLQQAHAAWANHSARRARRQRYKRYTYGDQWSDIVHDRHGRAISEAQLIRRSGQIPLSNNLIRRMIKAIIGQYRTGVDQQQPYDNLDPRLTCLNDLAEMDSRMLEEFLISGCAIQRVSNDVRPSGSGVWIDNVSPDRFFVEDFRDPRGTDITLLGMLHDMTPGEVISRFSHGDRARGRRIADHYGAIDDDPLWLEGKDAGDFFTAPRGRWRVIECWQLVPADTGDANNMSLQFKWHCRWLTPKGYVLSESDSPWSHGSHPFVLKFYPLTDGEVHSFVEDVIEQQHYINRVIVLMDKMLDSSAKGVLLFPVGQKPSNVTWEDIANNWASPDGIIPITDRTSHLPQQINSTAGDVGAHRLLEMQLKLFEDTSGVSSTLLGNTSSIPANGGSALFEAQLRQANASLADLMATFTAWRRDRDLKASMLLT